MGSCRDQFQMCNVCLMLPPRNSSVMLTLHCYSSSIHDHFHCRSIRGPQCDGSSLRPGGDTSERPPGYSGCSEGGRKKIFSASFCRLRNKTRGDQTASPKTLRVGIASEYPEVPTLTSTQRSLLHQGTSAKPLALTFMFYFTFIVFLFFKFFPLHHPRWSCGAQGQRHPACL